MQGVSSSTLPSAGKYRGNESKESWNHKQIHEDFDLVTDGLADGVDVKCLTDGVIFVDFLKQQNYRLVLYLIQIQRHLHFHVVYDSKETYKFQRDRQSLLSSDTSNTARKTRNQWRCFN